MDNQEIKLPDINERGSSSGQMKRKGSFSQMQGHARAAYLAKKERKE